MWSPKTHAGKNHLPTREMPQGGKQVQCPCCGHWQWDFAVVDVRKLNIPEDWACDGCWTHWIRTKREVDGQPLTRAHWIRLHKGPQDLIDKFEAMDPEHHHIP